jgi:uncharacterized membrane protein
LIQNKPGQSRQNKDRIKEDLHMASRSRIIVYSAVLAAAYFVITISLAPFSYGPIQFRVSELLKPAALLHPAFAIAFAIGNGLANTLSPFGWYDYVLMSIVDGGAALLCWSLRRWPWLAVTVQAVVISAGVAAFPLGLGAQLPFVPTFLSVLVSELILLLVGYAVIWRNWQWPSR